MVDTFNIHNNCNVVVLYYFSVNGVICCVIASTFSSTPKPQWHHSNADNFKTLKDNYMMVRLLCVYRTSKYVGKISL